MGPIPLETKRGIAQTSDQQPYPSKRGFRDRRLTLKSRSQPPTYPPPPDDPVLQNLCDDVRSSLGEEKELGARRDELMQILVNAVNSECDGVPTISLDKVNNAHLDKLLYDMLDASNRPDSIPAQFRADLCVAESLQRRWRLLFGDAYSGLDDERCARLTAPGGRLENMVFNEAARNNHEWWQAKKSENLSECEGDATFIEGHWWVNLACAHRDGILCSSSDVLSKGEYDIPTLPLLDGCEIANWPEGNIKYTREGTAADMWLPLLTHVGKRVRVLRGHLLQSPFAPKAGIRYDGQYTLLQYGQKRNAQSGVYELYLALERLEGQTPMHRITITPRPSEVDDWYLVEKLEGEMVKERCGEDRFLEWKVIKAEERVVKEEFVRIVDSESAAAIKEFLGRSRRDGKDTKGLERYRKLSDLVWER